VPFVRPPPGINTQPGAGASFSAYRMGTSPYGGRPSSDRCSCGSSLVVQKSLISVSEGPRPLFYLRPRVPATVSAIPPAISTTLMMGDTRSL